MGTRLGEQCAKLEKECGAKVHSVFYMAMPPSMFGEIPKYLGKAGLARDRELARIVVEQSIGYDLESALAMNAILAANFEAAWQLLTPVIAAWAVAPPGDFHNYAAGTWGPEDTQGPLAQGHSWPLPTELRRLAHERGCSTLNGRQKSVRRYSPSRWVVSVGASCSRFSALTQFCLLTPISCAG